MWVCCTLAVVLLVVGLLGPTLGVRVSMALKPAEQKSEAVEDLARIHWKMRQQWFYGGAVLLFLCGAVSAFVALNRPPD